MYIIMNVRSISSIYLSGKVYIGHHRDLLNIWDAPDSLKRLRHVSFQRSS
jgi:hypothetical protein